MFTPVSLTNMSVNHRNKNVRSDTKQIGIERSGLERERSLDTLKNIKTRRQSKVNNVRKNQNGKFEVLYVHHLHKQVRRGLNKKATERQKLDKENVNKSSILVVFWTKRKQVRASVWCRLELAVGGAAALQAPGFQC